MKNLILILCLLTSATLFGQTPGNVIDMQAPAPGSFEARQNLLRVQLQLTPHEDSVFWTVYHPFFDKMTEIKSQNKGFGKMKGMNMDSIPDDQVLAALQQQLLLAQQEANLKQEYLNKFLEVIPVKKVAKLYQLERGNTPNIKTVNTVPPPKQDIPENK